VIAGRGVGQPFSIRCQLGKKNSLLLRSPLVYLLGMHRRTLILAGPLALWACTAEPEPGTLQQSQACLEHSDADYRVVVDGVELAAHEGATVHVLTDMQLAFTAEHACVVSGPARVSDGAFTVALDNRTDGAAYPLVGAFIDVDGDGACTAGVDLEWRLIGSVAPGNELALTVGPDDFAAGAEIGVCAYFD
jgi:hypothetical protein